MAPHLQKWHAVFKLLRSAIPSVLVSLTIREIWRPTYANEFFYGFYFDLPQGYKAPKTPSPLTVRKFEQDDFFRLVTVRGSSTPSDLKKLIELKIQLLEGIPTCYGGFTMEGAPCCICWLVDYAAQDKLRSFFKARLPDLKPGEMLCENIYTRPDYRGNSLMAHLTFALFEIASGRGARRALAYVSTENAPSLHGIKKIGRKPFMVKKVRWRFFRRSVSFNDCFDRFTLSQ
jgi:Acetyltransferase (GNAT) family